MKNIFSRRTRDMDSIKIEDVGLKEFIRLAALSAIGEYFFPITHPKQFGKEVWAGLLKFRKNIIDILK